MTEASNCNVSRRDLLEAGVAAGVASLRSPTATRPRRSCRSRWNAKSPCWRICPSGILRCSGKPLSVSCRAGRRISTWRAGDNTCSSMSSRTRQSPAPSPAQQNSTIWWTIRPRGVAGCRTRPCAGRWRSTGTASPDVVYSKSISPAAWQPPDPPATAGQRWATGLKHELGLSVGKTIFGFALSWRVKYGTPTRNDVAPLSVQVVP